VRASSTSIRGRRFKDQNLHPEAHRNALTGDEILLAHFSTRWGTGLHLLDRCIWHA